MSYGFDHISINLAGPNGNIFALIALGNNIISQVEGRDAADEFRKKEFYNKKEFYEKMNMEHNWYVEILKAYQNKIGWRYISPRDLGYESLTIELITPEEEFWQPKFY